MTSHLLTPLLSDDSRPVAKWRTFRLFIPHFPPHSPISGLRQRAFRPRPESLSRPSFLSWSSTVLIQSRLTLGQAACRRHRSISWPVAASGSTSSVGSIRSTPSATRTDPRCLPKSEPLRAVFSSRWRSSTALFLLRPVSSSVISSMRLSSGRKAIHLRSQPNRKGPRSKHRLEPRPRWPRDVPKSELWEHDQSLRMCRAVSHSPCDNRCHRSRTPKRPGWLRASKRSTLKQQITWG